MIKEIIGTGKTIEEATQNAKLQLNAPETADVHVEIIAMPEPKRFFGLIGGRDAQVKVSYDDGKKEKKPARKKENKPAQKKQQKTTNDTRKAQTEQLKAQPSQPKKQTAVESKPEKAAKEYEPITEKDVNLDYACSYLRTMIEGLNVENAKIDAKIVDGVVEIDIDATDYGIIIGRRGETLDALQYLTGLAIKNETDKYVRVTINIGDYREKRAQTLTALAIKNANYALRYSRRYTFEPMNPYERRIIHTAVQSVEGVTSRSVGTGIDRRVIIEPEGGAKYQGSYRDRRGGGRGRGGRRSSTVSTTPDANREKKVDRADIPKFGKIQVNNTDND